MMRSGVRRSGRGELVVPLGLQPGLNICLAEAPDRGDDEESLGISTFLKRPGGETIYENKCAST